MKKLLIVFILFINPVFSQTPSFEKQVSRLFFNYDFTKKPSNIEEPTRMLFDTGPIPKKEQNIQEFTSNPLITSKFNKGYYNVIFAFGEYEYNQSGLYTLYMTINYKGSHARIDAKKDYEKLIKLFKETEPEHTSTKEPRDRSPTPKRMGTIFQLNKVSQVPRLEIDYIKVGGIDTYEIEIRYTTTWNFKLLKNKGGNIFYN